MKRLALTWKERRQLEQERNEATDPRVYRRTLAVLEAAEGRPIREIARMIGMTRQSVYNWIEVYASARDPRALAVGVLMPPFYHPLYIISPP